ncbi:serine protease [Nitrobacter winogradskyi]|uniref:Peptidoglycan hydrolase-like protein with peptidoglycan-binding domain n=2 Tax=Nitrobacter winogradskyi TaxID=913 RepID=A0ACC6AMA2_NITWI|nr:serine protease [Nitrobacter winogradskyi]MCP2000307.1 peptidoglycan hydrolase-like protein with peptidoglycan-binding domain [Nitrobacter winogradskyi]
MRAMIAAALMIVATTMYAQAQPGDTIGRARSKPEAAVPPPAQTPADTVRAMAPAARQALQSDLAWTGHYNGLINGEVGDRLIAAIKAFQKDQAGKQTGVLNPQERDVLTAAARKARVNVGWKITTDAATGVRLGLPMRLTPQQSSAGDGTTWSSSTGTIQISVTRRKEAGLTTARLADHERRQPPGRKVTYSAVKPDVFVLSGTQGLKKFYMRGQLRDSEARILTILYDQATEGVMEPVVIAMSSAFDPFPTNGPPPRKLVEYASGVIVSKDGTILTGHDATDGCRSIVVTGHGYADRIASDKDHGLALLRVYGAHGLQPIALGPDAKGGVDLVGITDPQNQGGGSAVSRVKASVAQGGGGESMLTPAPASGFSGAAALDANGQLAGLALLKPADIAGLSGAAPSAQAMLAPAEALRAFLKANDVDPFDGSFDAEATVVRVICVRR